MQAVETPGPRKEDTHSTLILETSPSLPFTSSKVMLSAQILLAFLAYHATIVAAHPSKGQSLDGDCNSHFELLTAITWK